MKNKNANHLLGQAAAENLIMVGFALAFIIPLAFLFMSSTGAESSKTSIVQAKVTVRTIADAAGELYLQGAGAKKTILVNFPEGVKDSRVEGGLVVLRLEPEAGRVIDITAPTFAKVQSDAEFGGIRNAGLQRIRMEFPAGKDYVEISYEQ